MCCSREHYPTEVGIWDVNNQPVTPDTDHYHLILPWSMSVGICLSRSNILHHFYNRSTPAISTQWRDFVIGRHEVAHVYKREAPPRSDLTRYMEEYSSIKPLGDLLVVAIAEGGELHSEWLKKTSEEFLKEAMGIKRDRPWEEWKILPPRDEQVLEYHEWLIIQAKKELEGREN